MRQITEQAVRAFLNGYDFRKDNTRTTERAMYLHNNMIALKTDGHIELNHCGWQTPTTKERLNGILLMLNKPLIYQKDFVWYRDIDGLQVEFKSGWNII